MEKLVYENVDETIYKEVLPNGLTVFLLPRLEMSKTYGFFSTKYGSIDHTFIPIGKDEKVTVPEGVAHFLEHKLFEKEDGSDAFDDFSKQGASANAYTSFTETAYLFSATQNIQQNVTTLLDFVQAPFFTEESVEKEKSIIDQELQMYLDEPDRRAFMGCVQAMFKNHPVRNEILGSKESIYAITKEDLLTSYYTFYHPENMTLFITGNFDVEDMMSLVKDNQAKKDFAPMEDIQRFMPDEPETVSMNELTIKMPVTTPKCVVGIKEYSSEIDKAELLERNLLQGMILEHFFGASGPFYKALYDEGLIDRSFSLQTVVEDNHGYTLLGGNTDDPEAFEKRIKELLLSTADVELTAETFKRMKKKRIGQLLRAMNSLEYIASEYVHYYTSDIDFFEMIPEIQALTVEQANTFIKNWISADRISVSKVIAE